MLIYLDVMASCSPKYQANNLVKVTPVFIAEVLSLSTEAFDRGNKFNAYRQLHSLQTYWLIDTNAMRIDNVTRTQNDDWLLHSYTQADEVVELKGLEVQCMLKELYEETMPS